MKSRLFLWISALTVMVFTSCQQDELTTGNNVKNEGTPGMLTFSLKSSDLKLRAMQTPPYDAAAKEEEREINNFTVFVYNADGATLNVPAVYFSSFDDTDNDGTSDPIDISITTAATSVVVVANLGNPYDNTSALYNALHYVNANGSANAIFDIDNQNGSLQASILDLNPTYGNTGYTTYGNIVQTGSQTITWVGTSASANVPMKFVPARISLESVQIFPDGNGVTDVTAMQNAGITSIALKEVYILNATSLSYITETNASGTNLNIDVLENPLVYEGKNVETVTSDLGIYGFYYPDLLNDGSHFMPLIELDTDLHGNVTAIPDGSGEYPYFYVWENPYTTPNMGITLLVIECEVQITGNISPERRYYTVPFTSGVWHNKHYHVSATIKSAGTDNPYDVMQNLELTVTKPTWDDQPVIVSFE